MGSRGVAITGASTRVNHYRILVKPHTAHRKTRLCRWTGNAATPRETILVGKSPKFPVSFVVYSLFAKEQDSLKEGGACFYLGGLVTRNCNWFSS